MKRTSNAYKMAMAKKYRGHSYMVVSLGIISNETQASAKVTSDTLYLSDNNSLFKAKGLEGEYASFEENSILADGKTIFPPEDNEYFQRVISCAAISEDIQGAITVQFDNSYDIKGLTIGFGNNYPTAFNLIVNDTDTTAYTNASETFETMDVFNGVNKLSIEPVSFIHGNNKRLRIEQMLMGVGIVFQNTDIQDANMEDATSFISEELPQLDFELVCLDRYKRFNIDDQNSFIHYLETGQRLNTSMGLELEDGSIEWVKMAPTYLTNWSSDSAKVTLRAADKFRVFLEGKYEAGNYIHTRTAYDEADRVFRDAGLEPDEYIIDDILRNITLVNPMPVVSHGEALQLLANCARCALKQDSNGRIIIFANFENIIEPTDINVDTDTQAAWSKPENIRVGSNIVYADFTKDFVSANGTMYFLPENGESYLETGYVSADIADSNGNFTVNPSVTLELPAAYTYYGMHFNFGVNPPEEVTVNIYQSDDLADSYVIQNPTQDYVLSAELYKFDKVEIVFNKCAPLNRAVLQAVSFGNLTDYRLTKSDMKKSPLGTLETKIRDVRVKVFTYVEETTEVDGEEVVTAHEVEDAVYYTKNINPTGEVITFENPLINTMQQAEQLAEWLANYYANPITYQVDFRGEPRLESGDYIYMDSDVMNNLQCEVDSCTLRFNGSISGRLSLRRAINMINS